MSYQAPPNGFRTFLVVWVTQSISVIGTALTFFAVNIWLTQTLYPLPEQKPALAWALSANGLAFALPAVFGAPLAGAWADRHDRKRTMMAMDFANGCLSLLLVTLLVTHNLQLWMLLVLSALYSTFGAFHMSSFDTSYAMLVPEHQLPRANGMMQTMVTFQHSLPGACRYPHLDSGAGAAGRSAHRSVGSACGWNAAGYRLGRCYVFRRQRDAALSPRSLAQAY